MASSPAPTPKIGFAMAGGICVLFGAIVLILLRVLPGPHRPTDYLVIGALATFVCLAALFLLHVMAPGKTGGFFIKRRR